MATPGVRGERPGAELGAELPAEILAGIVEHVLEGVAVLDGDGTCAYVNQPGRALLGASDDREAAEMISTAFRMGWWSQWSGLQFDDVPLDPESGRRLVTFRDASDWRVDQGRLDGLSRAVARFTRSGSLSDTLCAVAEEVRAALHLVGVSIVMLGEAADCPLHILGGAGFNATPEQRVARMRECEERGADFKYREAMRTGRLVVVPHRRDRVMTDGRWEPVQGSLGSDDWDGFLAAPLVARGQVIGAISAFCPPGMEMGREELGSFTAMADQAAVAIDAAGLLAQTQRRVAAEERNRLARELHDSIVQDVFSLALHSRTIQASAERGGPGAAERIRSGAADLIELSRSALTSLRALIFELRPPDLEDHSVVDAVQAYAASLARRNGVPIDVVDECHDPARSSPGPEHVYRVVQEALHNAVRHAQARRVSVRFSDEGQPCTTLRVDIADDGVGFDPDAVGDGHLGLVTMRERAELLGGTLEVRSRTGEGTSVRLSAPTATPSPTATPAPTPAPTPGVVAPLPDASQAGRANGAGRG